MQCASYMKHVKYLTGVSGHHPFVVGTTDTLFTSYSFEGFFIPNTWILYFPQLLTYIIIIIIIPTTSATTTTTTTSNAYGF
jgi:hypothetical protein